MTERTEPDPKPAWIAFTADLNELVRKHGVRIDAECDGEMFVRDDDVGNGCYRVNGYSEIQWLSRPPA